MAAVSCAVQNLHLQATAMGIAGMHWSAGVSRQFSDALVNFNKNISGSSVHWLSVVFRWYLGAAVKFDNHTFASSMNADGALAAIVYMQ